MPYFGNAPQFGDFPTAKLVGNGGTTYTLPFVLPNENTALVFLNGAPQVPGEHFSIIEDQLVFEGTVGAGVQIYVHGLGIGKALIAPSDGSTIATPNQFDASQKIANMAAVQRALGNLQAATAFVGNQTLTAADAGKMFIYDGAVVATITLPAISGVTAGCSFEFLNTGTARITVQRAGSDQIDGGASTVNSIDIPPGQSLRLVRATGSSMWHAVTFPAVSLNGLFGSSLAANGYQKLPSGLIIQWGATDDANTVKSFPIAFPNACFHLSGGLYPNVSTGAAVSCDILSLSTFRFQVGSYGSNTVYFFAIGY